MESLGYELCRTSFNHFQFVYVILFVWIPHFETVSLSLESGVVLDCIDI